MPNHLDDLVPGSQICVDCVPYLCVSRVPFDAHEAWVTLISPYDFGDDVDQYRSAFLSELIELEDAGRLTAVSGAERHAAAPSSDSEPSLAA